MKNFILLMLLSVFIANISCYTGQEILSKFHQHIFKVKDFRGELESYNKKYFNFYYLKTYKYNRTTSALNSTLNMKIDCKDKIEAVVQVYKFLSNEYRYFPIHVQVNMQQAFEENAIGLINVQNCGNMSSILFQKDVTYYTCNFIIDEAHFPPLIPNGRYKLEAKMIYLTKELAVINLFAEIYTPVDYPKK